jgi:hypothetical protein
MDAASSETQQRFNCRNHDKKITETSASVERVSRHLERLKLSGNRLHKYRE